MPQHELSTLILSKVKANSERPIRLNSTGWVESSRVVWTGL